MITFSGIILGMFAISVMQLVLATALPHIVSEIGGGNLYSLVFSSYMISSIVMIPIFSKLADTYGKKRFYLIGISIFAIGTLYGGLAPNMPALIIARIIQGLGAGILNPVSLALVSDMFTAEKRGRMIGIFGLVQLLSNLISPLLGKSITAQLGWHWLFFLTLIAVMVSTGIVAMSGKQPESSRQAKLSEIDAIGGMLFGVFCVLMVGFSNVISKEGRLSILSGLLLVGIVIAAVSLMLNEKNQKMPIIKIEFFKTKIIRRSILSSVAAGAIMYGLITILPLCGAMLNSQGFPIDESRILLFFMVGTTVGMVVSSSFLKKLDSTVFTKTLWIVMSIGAISVLYFISIGHLMMFNLLNALIGLCVGGIMSTFMINSQNAVGSEDRTVLSGLIQLGRYMGASVGVTFFAGVLPEVGLLKSVMQFSGAFGLLVALSLLGLMNEML
ncbi:MAG: MFS transporter [Clostridia bacterium]|jgi:MFS family permease|nr:MFS transporter [Clostridia bacterium]